MVAQQSLADAPLETSAPGPDGLPLLGIAPHLLREGPNYLVRLAHEFGEVVEFDLGPQRFFLLTNPDHVRHVLQANYRNYVKGYDKVKPVLGQGLVASEGDFWRRQRKLMAPAFHRQRLQQLAAGMTDEIAATMRRWEGAAERGASVDTAAEMMSMTRDIIVRTMFSADFKDEGALIGDCFEEVMNFLSRSLFIPFDIPQALPLPSNLRFRKAKQTLDGFIRHITEERRRGGEDRGDLLSMLLAARDEDTGEGMSDDQLRDELFTIFFAGHETTANTLAWATYLLSRHPEAQRRLREEAREVLQGRTPTFEDLPRLAYTRLVVDETLRLYPAAWMFARKPAGEDQVGRFRIGPDAMLMLSPFVMHRMPQHWENPEGFDPERFTEARSQGRHPFAYFPFGGGPRICIGNHFSLMETTLALAMIYSRYRVDLVPGHAVKVQANATLRPRPAVRVTLHQV
ncbi:MAG: cytochrome P450 [Myxococcota bacterium]